VLETVSAIQCLKISISIGNSVARRNAVHIGSFPNLSNERDWPSRRSDGGILAATVQYIQATGRLGPKDAQSPDSCPCACLAGNETLCVGLEVSSPLEWEARRRFFAYAVTAVHRAIDG
jgi:hypothetical protein